MKILYVFTSCRKTGPTQQILNIIKNIDCVKNEIILMTLYPENTDGTSILDWYLPYVKHIHIDTSKIDILLGKTKKVKKCIEEMQPDVIHSLGIFPDYLLRKYSNHLFTCRNYLFDDNLARYGKVMGNILAYMHLIAIKSTKFSICCSKSLNRMYKEKLGINLPYIQNGVDTDKFYPIRSKDEKIKLRNSLGLPEEKIIFIYGAAFNNRKNQIFILDAIRSNIELQKYAFLLIGDGPNYERLKEEYRDLKNVIMPGLIADISQHLRASDFCISSSKSEGLPNGVLEAMASGLPVMLSDIEQHKELFVNSEDIGELYLQGDAKDFAIKIEKIVSRSNADLNEKVRRIVDNHFSAEVMSRKYQQLYKLIEKGEINA